MVGTQDMYVEFVEWIIPAPIPLKHLNGRLHRGAAAAAAMAMAQSMPAFSHHFWNKTQRPPSDLDILLAALRWIQQHKVFLCLPRPHWAYHCSKTCYRGRFYTHTALLHLPQGSLLHLLQVSAQTSPPAWISPLPASSSVQFSCSVVSNSLRPLWTAALRASLSITNSQSLLKLMSIESVMPSNHLILCHPLLPPSIFPSIRVFSNESVLHIRWPKCCCLLLSCILFLDHLFPLRMLAP